MYCPSSRCERGTLLLAQRNPPVATHEPLFEVRRILDGGQPGRQRSSRGFVSGRRCLLVERFVGALDIELGSEPIEASLLASQCGGGRTRRFLLERLVHALVPSVLLGMAGLDELWVDTQANPPDGESAQSPDGRRRQGHPVVGANDRRQAVCLEEPVQHGFRTRVPCGAKPLAAEDKPCAAVGDGQRVAVLPITGLELTFEIDTPGVVRRVHRLGGLAGVARVGSSPLLLDQAVAGEQVTDGRPRRPRDPVKGGVKLDHGGGGKPDHPAAGRSS